MPQDTLDETTLDRTTGDPGPRGVAVVTGGSGGLGRAIVRRLAEDGYDVAVLARGRDGLAGAVADVAARGRRALGVPTDVARHAEVESAADQVEERLGPIDLWVNDAMTGVFGTFLEVDPDDYERVTAVTYLGFVNGTRAALRRMVPRRHGTVIQVGSALAYRGIPLQAAYCGAKHAITGFTEAVRVELLHHRSGVRLSQVDMPALNTMQFEWVKSRLPEHPQPVPPIYEPEVGARAVAAVAEQPRRRTWVGEPTVLTILGNRIMPAFWDWYLTKTGYSGQQTTSVTASMLPPNLDEPVPGDHGAHGRFDGRSHAWSPQTWAITHRRAGALSAAAVVLAAAAAGAIRRTASQRPKAGLYN